MIHILGLWLILVCSIEAESMKTERQLIDERLQLRFYMPQQWIGAEVSEGQIVSESNVHWERYIRLYQEHLSASGLGAREELATAKERVRDSWIKQREVLLERLRDIGVKAFRFDGGSGEPCGYVLLQDGSPYRLLSLRINRPDPNIGGVELPFPYRDGER